ncbi:hypothetical protein [Streptomyces atriruber]|nr:hypothetical protein [Streptomyces atriruber]
MPLDDDYLQWARSVNASLEPMTEEALRRVARTYTEEDVTPDLECA